MEGFLSTRLSESKGVQGFRDRAFVALKADRTRRDHYQVLEAEDECTTTQKALRPFL